MAGIATRPFSIQELLDYTVLGSVSRVYGIGREILKARKARTDPVEAITAYTGGKILITGKVYKHCETFLPLKNHRMDASFYFPHKTDRFTLWNDKNNLLQIIVYPCDQVVQKLFSI